MSTPPDQPGAGSGPAPDGEARRRAERSLAVAEASLIRFATATHRKSRWRIATTVFAKAAALLELERYGEAVAVSSDLLDHLHGLVDGPTQVLACATLRCRREALARSGRLEEARRDCEEIIRRFGGSDEPIIRQEVDAARVALHPPRASF